MARARKQEEGIQQHPRYGALAELQQCQAGDGGGGGVVVGGGDGGGAVVVVGGGGGGDEIGRAHV